jgi:hypothetical protein
MTAHTTEEWFAWREAERRKRRVMTVGEYRAWCRGGDAISSSAEANPFPGGLTILLGTPPIIGRTTP